MKKALAVLVILGALVGVAIWSVDIARALTFGWAQFLARVTPSITWDRNSVLLAVIAFALFTLGIHWIGRTWMRSREWKLGWSGVVSAAIVAAFAAGICMIGVVHQTGWLARADEPMMVQVDALAPNNYRSRMTSWSNLRMLGIGYGNFVDSGSGYGYLPGTTQRFGWGVQILTQINYNSNDLDYQVGITNDKNKKLLAGVIPEYTNPSLPLAPLRNADGYGLSHYAANCRIMREGTFRLPREFTDGQSRTLAIGEVNANFRPWADPANVRDPARGINRSAYGFGGPLGTGGALFAMADGSVRFISEKVSPEVLKALATPDGGETIEDAAWQDVK